MGFWKGKFVHSPVMLLTVYLQYSRVQWQIQDFPGGGANRLVLDKNLLFGKIFAKNCMEIKEIGLRGGVPSALPSTWIRQ